MPSVDLNADVGEREVPDGADDALVALVSSVSIACGGHAGNDAVMTEVLEAARRCQVAVGAHCSYPDRAGFGRISLQMEPDVLTDELATQIGRLVDIARHQDQRVRYVKAHGALYNDMAGREDLAIVVATAVRAVADLVVLLPAGSRALSVVERAGLTVASEGFADRAYLGDGSLAPRSRPGALLSDPAAAAEQALTLAAGGELRSLDGRPLHLVIDSICLHGDTPGALSMAAATRRTLEAAGFTLAPFAP